jgi:hypothetical protein
MANYKPNPDYCFHLPTLIIFAIITISLLWYLANARLDVGSGFIRFSSNQGQVQLFWMNGCCDLDID